MIFSHENENFNEDTKNRGFKKIMATSKETAKVSIQLQHFD